MHAAIKKQIDALPESLQDGFQAVYDSFDSDTLLECTVEDMAAIGYLYAFQTLKQIHEDDPDAVRDVLLELFEAGSNEDED